MILIISVVGIVVGIVSIVKRIKGAVFILLYWILGLISSVIAIKTDWEYLVFIISGGTLILLLIWIILINKPTRKED